jgi:excisionase family DNA binding protein
LVDLEEAVRMLKTTRPTFYRWLRAGRIRGMKAGRQWRFERSELERFLKGEAPRIEAPGGVHPLVQALRARLRELGGEAEAQVGLDPVEEAARLMCLLAVRYRASDMHLTVHPVPGESEPRAAVRCRVDGVLHVAALFDRRALPAVVAQWKRMAACNVGETNRPQDGRILMELGWPPERRTLDMRVNFLPGVLGESVTARILDPGAVLLKLDRIPFSDPDRERVQRALKLPYGLVVCAGPTGSGKTTTLYACLTELARPGAKVISIEDPVEYCLPWVMQVNLRAASGGLGALMRAALRSDPDVINLCEVRDPDSLNVAAQAALTGHLVFTQLHTQAAVATIERFLQMGLPPFLVADTLRLVIAQRLARKLCPRCSAPAEPDAAKLEDYAQIARAGGLPWPPEKLNFRRPVGCEHCRKTGFRGRTLIAEVLEVTSPLAQALRKNAPPEALRQLVVQQGMTTMAADGLRRAATGEIEMLEVLRLLA